MDIDVATFKAFLPAFKNSSEPWIQLHLAASQLVCLEEVYETRLAEAVFYHAASRMALDPAGFGAKLDKQTEVSASTYKEHWKQIALECGVGWRNT